MIGQCQFLWCAEQRRGYLVGHDVVWKDAIKMRQSSHHEHPHQFSDWRPVRIVLLTPVRSRVGTCRRKNRIGLPPGMTGNEAKHWHKTGDHGGLLGSAYRPAGREAPWRAYRSIERRIRIEHAAQLDLVVNGNAILADNRNGWLQLTSLINGTRPHFSEAKAAPQIE